MIDPPPQIENAFLSLAFDPTNGRLVVKRREGGPLLIGGIARVNGPGCRRSMVDAAYHRSLDTRHVHDDLGEGQQVTLRCFDSEKQLDIQVHASLYNERAGVLVEVECQNVSTQPIILESIEPLCVLSETAGRIHAPGVTKVLTNGPMYYDPGKVADLPSPTSEPLHSWWNAGLFQGYKQEGLVCGYLENQTALGQVSVRRIDDTSLGLRSESILAKGFELHPGQTVRSGRFMVQLAPDPYTALEAYADAMGQLLKGRVHSIINGWCSWFVTFEFITEDEVLRNAEIAARVLKPYGLEYIQMDEGFQRWHGDWEGNDRFPHGMKWLADRIHALGLKPGIWIAPYIISEPTDVFRDHPDWLLKHMDGRLKRVGPWPSEDSEWARNEKIKRYGLDITHPGAAAWLANLFDTLANQWGYEMVKIDFVDWSLLSAHRYHDPTVSRAQAYRRGFEIMRQALGSKCHLLDCGPGPVTVGLLDSMRIELDQYYGYREKTWNQYFRASSGSAPAAAKRYYFHKRTWINDADHICLNALSLSQAQAAVTLLALTGGNLISGDRLTDLDPIRMEFLKKVFPSFGEAARPVDLFDTDIHSAFALRISKPFGEWVVAGFFNSDEVSTKDQSFTLDRLWLDPTKTYLAYDFWNERLHGEVTGELRVTIPPASVTLLALHEKRNVPQVLSTDRHILQGAIELEDVRWNPGTNTLEGVSLGPQGTSHNLAVYLPEAHTWTQSKTYIHHDFPGYTVKMMDEHLLRIRVRFEDTSRVSWQVDFGEFFA